MATGAIIGSAAIGAIASSKASSAQKNSAQSQLGLESQIYNETVERFEPALQSGNRARSVLDFEYGIGERPTFGGEAQEVTSFQDQIYPGDEGYLTRDFSGSRNDEARSRNPNYATNALAPQQATRYRVGDEVFGSKSAAEEYAEANPAGGTEYQGFQATPGYQFQLDQGLAAIDNGAASRGTLDSGATIKSYLNFGQGLANQEYSNYLARLSDVANSGQAAAGNAATAGSNFAAGSANANNALGNALSAGTIGANNYLQNGLQQGVGLFNYQNQLAGNKPFNVPEFSSGSIY